MGLSMPNPNVFATATHVFVVTAESNAYSRPGGGTYNDPYISVFSYSRGSNTWANLLPRTILRLEGGGYPQAHWGADGNIWILGSRDATGEKILKINVTSATLETIREPAAAYGLLLWGINYGGSLLHNYAGNVRALHSTILGQYGYATSNSVAESINASLAPLPDGTSIISKYRISLGISPTYTSDTTLLNGSSLALYSWQRTLPNGKIFVKLSSGARLLDMNFTKALPSQVLFSKWFNRKSF
jgi:hypothetical protein